MLSWFGTITSQRCLVYIINIDIDGFYLILFLLAGWYVTLKTLATPKYLGNKKGN